MPNYRWKWTAAIDPESLTSLQKLAASLGFVVTRYGGFQGKPSPAAMLDALAAAYERDPAGVRLAFKVLGITPDGKATFSSLDGDDTAE